MSRPVEHILRAVDQAHLRHVGHTHEDEAGTFCRGEEGRSLVGNVASQRARSTGQLDVGDGRIVLDQEGNAREWTIAQRFRCTLSSAVIGLVNDRVQLRIDRLDLADRILDELARRDLLRSNQLGKTHRIVG